MVKLQELISLFSIFIPLTPSSGCDFFVTVTEDEAVQLDFPYPCDSHQVTIQSAQRLPFYNSEEPEFLILPSFQSNRFSVTDGDCSVQVQINSVNRNDEATYISKAYRDRVIQGRYTKIRLNVNYPPGKVSCTLSINDDAVGDWLPLQCMAPVGSLAGGIYCYQDTKRLPPLSKLVQNGENLIQTIWAKKEYPVFCCSSSLDRHKDRCECKDFAWDPMEDISQTNTNLDPCPATTPGPVATLSQYPEREVEDNPRLPQLIESLNLTDTNKSTANNITIIWVDLTAIGIMAIIVVIISMRLYVVEKTNKQLKKCQSTNIYQLVENESPFISSPPRERKISSCLEQ